MSELERELTLLGREVDWPATPSFRLRLEEAPRRDRRRRGLVLAVALAVLALAIAFAVPPARSALLRIFHIGGATVERVETLPAAEERPLAAGLGREIGLAEATEILGRAPLLPDSGGTPRLYEQSGVVSALLATPDPVLISQMRSDNGIGLMKKLAAGGTAVEWLQVTPSVAGIWLSGAPHVFYFPSAPPRVAGNVLLFETDTITARLEGASLTRDEALRLARDALDG